MNFYELSALINAFISIILGIFVYYKNFSSKLNRSLFFFCFTAFFWAIFYFLWQIEMVESKALLWTRILMLGAIWIPIAYFRVVIIFLKMEKEKRVLLYFSCALAAIFSLLLLTSLMVKNVEPLAGFRFWPKPGLAYIPFLIMFLGLNFYCVLLSYRALKNASPVMRAQIKLMLFGMAISILGGSTNYFLWYDIPIKPYGNILVPVYVIFTVYAIVAHRLMDIKMVMRRSSVFLASLSVVLVSALAVKYIFDRWFYGYSSWADPLILVAALFIFPPIRNRFYKLANKYFFSSLYDSGEVIASLSDKLRTTLETERIYDFIYQTLTNAFHVKAFGLLIYSEADKNYTAEYNNGFSLNGQKIFYEDKLLDQMFIKKNQPVITEDAAHTPELNGNKNIELLKKLGVEILAPLNVKDKTIGLIALGKKESGDMYNEEDLQVLEVVGAQTAIALENALLYKETKNFSIKLEKEVEKATRDLKKANIQLKESAGALSDLNKNLEKKVEARTKKAEEKTKELEKLRVSLLNMLEDIEESRLNTEKEKNKTLAIIKNFTDGLLFFDAENKLSLINPRVKDFFGAGEEVIGKSTLELSSSSALEILINFLGQEVKKTYRKEFTSKEGLILEVSAISVLAAEEKLGTLIILHDITREKAIEKMKTEFVSIAAHQLRTPLSAIKWVVKMVLDGDAGKLTKEQHELLNKGYLSNERIIKLVNDLLNVSRMEEGRFGFNFEKADFQEIVYAAVSSVENLAAKNHQELTVQKPDNLPEIYLDKERMIMVMQNLLSNAIKYTPEYGKITMTIKVDKQYLYVKIKDQGVGIPKNDQPKIFSKFFRAANVIKLETEGTGMGLFLVKNIIDKHHGKVSLTSEEGKGTEVSFFIPINKI